MPLRSLLGAKTVSLVGMGTGADVLLPLLTFRGFFGFLGFFLFLGLFGFLGFFGFLGMVSNIAEAASVSAVISIEASFVPSPVLSTESRFFM